MVASLDIKSELHAANKRLGNRLAEGITIGCSSLSAIVLSDGFYSVDSEEFRKHYKTVSY